MEKFKIPIVLSITGKTIRFPNDVLEAVEKAIEGKDCTFTVFCNRGCLCCVKESR